MKRTILWFILILCSLALLLTGCAQSTPNETARCAKCGGTATTTLSGTDSMMQDYGIPLSKCTLIADNIYSAQVCGSCIGPVVDIKPDPTF